MATKTKSPKRRVQQTASPKFILLGVNQGWRDVFGSERAIICKRDQDLAEALARATVESLWISSGPSMTDELLRVVSRTSSALPDARLRWGNLVTLESPRPKTIPFLRTLFRNLVGEAPAFKWLPHEHLCEVIAAGSAAGRDVFIGGVIDPEVGLLTLVRGNFERVTVSLSMFRPSGSSKPDFRRFGLDDYGHTIRFGEYEASADFVLYEADAEYRKRMNARRRAEEKTFGASLRRLRIQRSVSQGGFPGITAKTIGRIERGEVARPHGATLKTISETLGVLPEDIETY
jgi:hypothetical protein